MKKYANRILTGLVLGLIVIAGIIISDWSLAILISAASVIAVWELAIALKRIDMLVPVVPTCIFSAILPFSVCFGGITLLMIIYIIGCGGIFLYSSFERTIKQRHTGAVSGIFAITYIPLMLSFYVIMRTNPDGLWLVLLVVLGTVSSDTGGLICGSIFGRHKMSPVISPQKTWEGLIGSFLLCVIVLAIYCLFALPQIYLDGRYWVPALLSVIIVLIGTFGDLVESVIKREVDVKDIGGILPGHGGILDRVDSLIVLAPFAYFIISLVI